MNEEDILTISKTASAEKRLNQGYEYREFLGPDAEGQTLLDYLSRRYRHSSATEWEARIADGQVLIDSLPVAPKCLLRSGSTLIWRRPPWIEPDAPLSFSILYEDRDLLAVSKPAGLPTLPGANFLQSTLLYQVRFYDPEAAPLHRLGRWTSGIVLCARSRDARANLIRQWSAPHVVKRYRALATGCSDYDEMDINIPIGTVRHAVLGTIHAAASDGKPALSKMHVIERRDDSFLCDVYITTGRPHQIRIHLASVGFPLLGDPLYGVGGLPKPDSHALPGDPGYQLHAAELGVRHPSNGRALHIACEPPPKLRVKCRLRPS
jgi:23S rRNA pseudouridine1911/1915/1917 synthase